MHIHSRYKIISTREEDHDRELAEIKQKSAFTVSKFDIQSVYGQYDLDKVETMGLSFLITKQGRVVASIVGKMYSTECAMKAEIVDDEDQVFMLALALAVFDFRYKSMSIVPVVWTVVLHISQSRVFSPLNVISHMSRAMRHIASDECLVGLKGSVRVVRRLHLWSECWDTESGESFWEWMLPLKNQWDMGQRGEGEDDFVTHQLKAMTVWLLFMKLTQVTTELLCREERCSFQEKAASGGDQMNQVSSSWIVHNLEFFNNNQPKIFPCVIESTVHRRSHCFGSKYRHHHLSDKVDCRERIDEPQQLMPILARNTCQWKSFVRITSTYRWARKRRESRIDAWWSLSLRRVLEEGGAE